MAKRVFPPFLLLIAGVILVFMGCGRAINRTAERRIREALPQAIGPAREYSVHVENSPVRTIQGQFANVTIDGDDVQFPSGLLLDNLHIQLKNVDVDTGKGRVRHIGEARFAITVSEKSLDEFIAGESPAGETIRKTRLSLADNNIISVTGERVTLGLGVPFRITGPIHVASPTRIELDASHLTVIGIPFGGLPLKFLKQRIESSVDLSQFPVPVQLFDVKTQRGSMTLTGEIDAQALLAQAQAHK
jgi:hypothetical protein